MKTMPPIRPWAETLLLLYALTALLVLLGVSPERHVSDAPICRGNLGTDPSGSLAHQGKFGPTVVFRDHHFASFKESPAGTFRPVLLPLPKVLILLPFH